MLGILGIFTLIAIFIVLFVLLFRSIDRTAKRQASRAVERISNERFASWLLHHHSSSRRKYVWFWFFWSLLIAFGLCYIASFIFGSVVYPGLALVWLIWRYTGHLWDAYKAREAQSILEAASTLDSPTPTDPAPTIPEQFFVHAQEETKGPYTQAQVISMWDSGVLTADTLYWCDNAQMWLPLRELIVPDDGETVPTPPPASPAARRWTQKEWITVAILLPLALLVWGAVYSALPKRAAEITPAPATVVAPSPTPSEVISELRTQQAAVAEQVQKAHPEFNDPNSLLSRAAFKVRDEWNRNNDARLSSPYMARLLVDEVLERTAVAQREAQATPTPSINPVQVAVQQIPPEQIDPNVFQRAVEESRTRINAKYPDLWKSDSILYQKVRSTKSAWQTSSPDFFKQSDWPELLVEACANDLVKQQQASSRSNSYARAYTEQPQPTQYNGRPLPSNWIDPEEADRRFQQQQLQDQIGQAQATAMQAQQDAERAREAAQQAQQQAWQSSHGF